MRKMKHETKKNILRVIMLIMAVAMLLGIVILPLASNVSAEGVDVIVDTFSEGQLSSAIEKAKNGEDLNNITRLSVSGGTLNSADFEAIKGYPNLTAVDLKNAEVKDGNIPDYALDSRNQLASLTLPKNTVTIGAHAFENNRRLESITIPTTVRNIGDYAFSGCEKVTAFSLPAKTESIGAGAFADCKALAAFELPEAITEIPDNCFSKAELTEIHIGPHVTRIGANAFENCHGLENVYFYGDTAPEIAGGAFQNVHTTIHAHEGTEGFDGQTNEFISVAYDLSPDSVYTPPQDIEPEPEPETDIVTDSEEEVKGEEQKSEAETSVTEKNSTPEAAETSEQTQAPTAANKNSGGMNIIIVILVAVIVILIAVCAILVKKINSKK